MKSDPITIANTHHTEDSRIGAVSRALLASDARVKLLEEALRDVLSAERFSNRLPETVMQAEAKLDRIRAAVAKAEGALSPSGEGK